MAHSTNGVREHAYQALRESEELHRATLSAISDAVFLVNNEGFFTYICPNVDVIFGYCPAEVHAMSSIDGLLGANLFDAAELSRQGEIPNIERQITAKSGEQKTILVQVKQVSIKGGTVLCSCRDVTELRNAERKLAAAQVDAAHASRLAIAGQLLASIIHELHQPLTAIHSNASAGIDLAQPHNGRPDNAELGEIFADILQESRRAADVMHRLRALMSKRAPELRHLDLNEVAKDALRLVATDARHHRVAIQSELDDALPFIHGDRVSLQQVILNLLLNAIDAIDQRDGERIIKVQTAVRAGEVEVCVIDTGSGVPPKLRSQLFDAFITTKPEGMGLGLAIARSIVEAHRGRIWLDEQYGRGSKFCIALPAAPLDVGAEGIADAKPSPN